MRGGRVGHIWRVQSNSHLAYKLGGTIKKLILSAAVLSASTLGLVGVAGAQTSTDVDSFASRLAQRFNLEESEVFEFIEESRQERREAKAEARTEALSVAVEDGVITQIQLDALLERKEESQAARQALRDSNAGREEIRDQIQSSREEFQAWAEAEGIDLEELSEYYKGSSRSNNRG